MINIKLLSNNHTETLLFNALMPSFRGAVIKPSSLKGFILEFSCKDHELCKLALLLSQKCSFMITIKSERCHVVFHFSLWQKLIGSNTVTINEMERTLFVHLLCFTEQTEQMQKSIIHAVFNKGVKTGGWGLLALNTRAMRVPGRHHKVTSPGNHTLHPAAWSK